MCVETTTTLCLFPFSFFRFFYFFGFSGKPRLEGNKVHWVILDENSDGYGYVYGSHEYIGNIDTLKVVEMEPILVTRSNGNFGRGDPPRFKEKPVS